MRANTIAKKCIVSASDYTSKLNPRMRSHNRIHHVNPGSHQNTARVLLLGLELIVSVHSSEDYPRFAYLGIEHLALS